MMTEKQSKGEQKRMRGGKRETIRHSSLPSRWINYADQITEKGKLVHYERTKTGKTERAKKE